jgi:hypothetical protein
MLSPSTLSWRPDCIDDLLRTKQQFEVCPYIGTHPYVFVCAHIFRLDLHRHRCSLTWIDTRTLGVQAKGVVMGEGGKMLMVCSYGIELNPNCLA